MSASQRNKGQRGEREVVALFKENGWPDARRTSDGNAQEGRGDIANGPIGCHVEVKYQERLSVPAALDQVKRDAQTWEIPVLVHRPSRHEWMATIPLTDLLFLLNQ